MSNNIRVLVDSFEQLETKSGLPLPGLENAFRKVVNAGVETLNQGIDESLKNIFVALENSTLQSKELEVNEIKFTLQIDASGEVSLVSVAKGAVAGQSGLEFTITKRRP